MYYIYMCVIHQDFWLHEIEDARRVLGPLRRGKSRLLKKVQAKGGGLFFPPLTILLIPNRFRSLISSYIC